MSAPTEVGQLDVLLDQATLAAAVWLRTSRRDRAAALSAVADALDGAADELVPVAMEETHLAEGRLRGELKRTSFQLRLFAEVVVEGGYLDVRIDHADVNWPMGAPRPDLRRTSVALGPVVVFAASNFPFAFSVAGGDTASALAAGCSVVVKVHDGHPQLSQATAEVVHSALASVDAPDGLFSLISGTDAGREAVAHPLTKAGAFTGSIAGGRALFDIAQQRPEPIPFFGELGSVNPVFVTADADRARGASIADEFVASLTMGAGQFCTKPGLLVVPAESTVLDHLRERDLGQPAQLLNDRIADGYAATLRALVGQPDVDLLAGASSSDGGDSSAPSPTLLTTTTANLLSRFDEVFVECFGPAGLVATYATDDELLDLVARLDGQLTVTLVGEGAEPRLAELSDAVSMKAGRVLWNQWPTGVSVTYAQQHGGPYPATTAPGTTSVGTAAISRFVRPVSYQNYPQPLLPDELRDQPECPTPRRIDGTLDVVG